MKAFFQLIRWRNILIIFYTQFVVWLFAILPFKQIDNADFLLSPSRFLLLTLSTMCIAAGGYIINDYFDVDIDLINKPDKVIVGRKIKRRAAILWHSIFNILGILFAMILCEIMNNYWPLTIQISCSILLWFYSTTFKKQFVTGNIIVALLASLTVLTIAAYSPSIYHFYSFQYFIHLKDKILPNPLWVIIIYSFFAFMLTWVREIIKDMQDAFGDANQGCTTMPIKLGVTKTTRIVSILCWATALPLCFSVYVLFNHDIYILGAYITLALIIPIFLLSYYLPQKHTSEHYAKLSIFVKLVMILGILSLVIYTY